MAPGPGLPSTVARLHYFHSVTFNATVLVTSMGREVIFNLPSWPLTKPLLCTVTGSSPVTATELPQPQPQVPSLHESISDPASSRTAKDCHIRRWLIRWHNMTHWYRAAFFLTLTRRSRGDSRTTCSWTYETETTSRCCSATWHSCLRALAQAQYTVVVGTSGARAPLQRRKELNITELRISYYPRYTCLTCATPA